MGTLLDEMIHIMPGCIVHLHGHWNKMVPLVKPSILGNLNNGIKFCNCICWSSNDTRSHHLQRQISNHHIGNEDLILLGHIEIDL